MEQYVELPECPFCGGAPLAQGSTEAPRKWRECCRKCLAATGWHNTPEEARIAWATRVEGVTNVPHIIYTSAVQLDGLREAGKLKGKANSLSFRITKWIINFVDKELGL